MRVLMLFAVAALAVPDRPNPSPPQQRSPQEQLLGDWVYTGNDARVAPNPNQPHFVFRFLPAETVWIVNGKPDPSNGFTAIAKYDFTKNPVEFDLMPPVNGGVIRGLLKLEGDKLTIVWSHTDMRPKDFNSGPHLHHFVRAK